VASTLLLPLFLGLTGYALNLAFEDSLSAAESERLQSQVYLLLGAAEMEGETLRLPEALTEPRFSQLNSGLFAQVSTNTGQTVWLSESGRLYADELSNLHNKQILHTLPLNSGQTFFDQGVLAGKAMFMFYHDVSWDTDDGQTLLFRISIYHEQSLFIAERQAYRAQLWRWLGAAGVLLILMQWLILRWGLQPLTRLAADLKAIESGKREQLEGIYPEEVQQVTDNFNSVLVREQHQRERYRNSLSDLAHSLKTPLAVLRGSLNTPNEERGGLVESQVLRMDEIIGRQLQRAITRNLAPQAQVNNIEEIVERLALALGKVYRDKNVHFTSDIEAGCGFNGDARDLMEVLGNLLENAFKYGRQGVALSARVRGSMLEFSIGDDGPGIAPELQSGILQRGARADTAQMGQGIGLSMAAEIISGYGGSLSVGSSHLGGAEFLVSLPL